MHLNLPILDALRGCERVLVAGAGGGFDVVCGLPLYFELRDAGKEVHLASLSFSELAEVEGGHRLTGTLLGLTPEVEAFLIYFPELHLARWFRERRGEDVTLWCLERTGAKTLAEDYRALLAHLQVDGIILVDGGVDSLVRGDEASLGTIVEDAVSLAAVYELSDLPARVLACVGFGAEPEVTHAHIFENVAELTRADQFLGSCSLVRRMDCYQAYEEAVTFIHEQAYQDPSVINASIVSAVRGHHGDYHLTEKTRGSRLWISPLMPIYWFFELPAVAERNLFLSQLRPTRTFREARQALFDAYRLIPRRPEARIPLL
jgi:hypothetical protein